MNNDQGLLYALLRSEGVVTFGIVVRCVVIAVVITAVTVIAARLVPL
jgi:hypothetical protein